MAKSNNTTSAKPAASRAAGSMKTVDRTRNTVSTNRDYGSSKNLYTVKSKDKEKEEEQKQKQKNVSAAGSMKDASRDQRKVKVDRSSASIKSLYSANPDGGEQQADDDKSINFADFYKEDKALITSPKSMYNSTWADRPKEPLEYTLDDLWPRKPPEERVNVGQLAYGVFDQAANELFGNTLSTVDMLVGTPLQKTMDFAEKQFGWEDRGENFISAYNRKFQENAEADAEYYAQNAAKSELAGLINEYGPDIVAMIPEIALALASGGTSAAASAGVKGLKAVSKADDVADVMKIAGRWVKNNPTVAMNFIQTTGDARNQALSEGASENEAYLYALTNGGIDAMITKYGVGDGRRGIESLPEGLRDAWKKISTKVKSADAVAQEIGEGQIRDAMQRASRGIYDENAKLISLSDKNAVFNPEAMLESALMDALPPALMGGFDRRKGRPEPARVEMDKDTENTSHDKVTNEGNTGNKNKKKETQESEQQRITQSVLDGNLLKSGDFREFNMRDPETQKLISEKSGIPISRFDNPNEALLRQKFQLAAIEIAKKKEKESSSKSSLEKEKGGTYNKTKGRK